MSAPSTSFGSTRPLVIGNTTAPDATRDGLTGVTAMPRFLSLLPVFWSSLSRVSPAFFKAAVFDTSAASVAGASASATAAATAIDPSAERASLMDMRGLRDGDWMLSLHTPGPSTRTDPAGIGVPTLRARRVVTDCRYAHHLIAYRTDASTPPARETRSSTPNSSTTSSASLAKSSKTPPPAPPSASRSGAGHAQPHDVQPDGARRPSER